MSAGVLTEMGGESGRGALDVMPMTVPPDSPPAEALFRYVGKFPGLAAVEEGFPTCGPRAVVVIPWRLPGAAAAR